MGMPHRAAVSKSRPVGPSPLDPFSQVPETAGVRGTTAGAEELPPWKGEPQSDPEAIQMLDALAKSLQAAAPEGVPEDTPSPAARR